MSFKDVLLFLVSYLKLTKMPCGCSFNVFEDVSIFSIRLESRGAESWRGCSDSDSGSDSGFLIDSDSGSDSDSDSGSHTKYKIHTTFIVEQVSAVQAKKAMWRFLLILAFIPWDGRSLSQVFFLLFGLLAAFFSVSRPPKEPLSPPLFGLGRGPITPPGPAMVLLDRKDIN